MRLHRWFKKPKEADVKFGHYTGAQAGMAVLQSRQGCRRYQGQESGTEQARVQKRNYSSRRTQTPRTSAVVQAGIAGWSATS
jgi:hypothetical protein